MYRIAGNFRGIQFLWMGDLQRFRDLIFVDGPSRNCSAHNIRLASATRKPGESYKRQQSIVLSVVPVEEIAQVLCMTEAVIYCRPADKQQVREACGNPRSMMTVDLPPANLAFAISKIAHGEFYFADLIIVVCESTAKTTKVGSLEDFQVYGICSVRMTNRCPVV